MEAWDKKGLQVGLGAHSLQDIRKQVVQLAIQPGLDQAAGSGQILPFPQDCQQVLQTLFGDRMQQGAGRGRLRFKAFAFSQAQAIGSQVTERAFSVLFQLGDTEIELTAKPFSHQIRVQLDGERIILQQPALRLLQRRTQSDQGSSQGLKTSFLSWVGQRFTGKLQQTIEGWLRRTEPHITSTWLLRQNLWLQSMLFDQADKIRRGGFNRSQHDQLLVRLGEQAMNQGSIGKNLVARLVWQGLAKMMRQTFPVKILEQTLRRCSGRQAGTVCPEQEQDLAAALAGAGQVANRHLVQGSRQDTTVCIVEPGGQQAAKGIQADRRITCQLVELV